MWVTLPNWFWVLYYLFFLVTFLAAIFNVVKGRYRGISILSIVLSIITPINFFMISLGRDEGMNEFEYLFNQLQQGGLWSIFTAICFLYLITWWVLIFVKRIRETR